MQGQRSFAQPFHDSYEFEPGTSSSSSSTNQQVLWNNMLFNSSEIQSMTDRLVSSRDANNVASQDGAQLSIWGSNGSSSSQLFQQTVHEDNKLENGWGPYATVSSRGGPRIEENLLGGSRLLTLDDDTNGNRNTSHNDGVQSFPQNNPQVTNLNQNTDNAALQVGIGNEFSESRLPHHPYTLGFLDTESVPSVDLSIPIESSCENVGLLREEDDRPESSMDARRVSGKRKNSEGFPGQSSSSGNTSSSHQRENNLPHSRTYDHMTGCNISSSAVCPSVSNSTGEYPVGFSTTVRGMASDCYPSTSTAGNAESSHRNYRMRTSLALPYPITWPMNTVGQSDLWLPNQHHSHSISLNPFLEPAAVLGTSSQNQPHLPVVHGQPQIVYHFPWNGASTSRIASSSGSFSMEDRLIAAREPSHSRNIPLPSNLDIVPSNIRNVTQDHANWNLGNRSVSMVSSSHTGANSGLHPTLAATWLHHQTPSHYPQPLVEAMQPSLYPSSSPESGGQGPNFNLQRSGHSFSSHEVAQQIRASLHGPHMTSHVRSSHLIRRRNDGLLGAPITIRSLTAAGEERSRMLTEIRQALESLRRGDGLRFETLILEGSDMYDRHRDMRLDVDSMSYEELLALEERIGDVCTGLTEETIVKCLKQRKHLSINFGPSIHYEPCCICQEEYVEGEDLGILHCGHDFHTVCIKQWLMHKNICPICKNTALVT